MYVDGFIVPVPRDRIEDYRRFAEASLAVWIEHGAISAVEAVGDDVPDGVHTSFPMAVKLAEGEVVVFCFVTYRSREDRDAVLAKVFADPRMEALRAANEGNFPFDGRRSIWGGFRPLVQCGAAL